MYNSNDGANWNHNDNWGTDLPLDRWYGVSVDEKEHVYSIDLAGNNLTGTIPESIGKFVNLNYLYLNNNQLTGTIPESIGNLGNLKGLQLSQNQLTGSIPESIGNLVNLNYLYLNNNQLTGDIPESIGKLGNLGGLYLNNNQLTGGIPDSFMNLTKLEYLDISRNRMDGTLSETLTESEWWAKLIKINLNQQDGYKLKYGRLYESTDFSQDGKVTILQQHQKGIGIKISNVDYKKRNIIPKKNY